LPDKPPAAGAPYGNRIQEEKGKAMQAADDESGRQADRAHGGFGARLLGPNRTLFRLWAPSANAVALVLGEGPEALPMNRLSGGWYELEADCGAGTRYRFRLEDGLQVPDPASRAQDRNPHGASVVTDPAAHAWRDAGWRGRPWQEAVIYELHVGAFGGFAGVAKRLPELAAIGITAIELMPIAAFPGEHNWGYDGVLPYAPDNAYGSPEDLKALVDAAHAQGVMVFLDVVYNHFGPDGNYLNSYAREFFRTDVQTPWGAAIDFRRPEVREFFIENAVYWLNEFHMDGLRFDALHAISGQEWLPELAAQIRARAQRRPHLVMEHEDNAAALLGDAFDAQWNDDGHHALHVLLTGEHHGYYSDYADAPAQRLARCLEQGFIYQGEASAHRGGKPRGEPSAQLPPWAFVLFLQNHDQVGNRALGERLTTLAEPAALRAAMALLLLSPQIPLLFMGEPSGATEPFLYFTDFGDDNLAAAVREGRRNEFAAFAEFALNGKRDAIPDPNDPETFRASVPAIVRGDARSPAQEDWLAWTAALLRTRHAAIVPRLAGCRAIRAWALSDHAVAARWRMGDGSILALAVNLGAQPVAFSADARDGGADLVFETPGAMAALEQGMLPGFGFLAMLVAKNADAPELERGAAH
jgi:maltooligosyltrehalose trehalohydrolase